MDCGNGIRLNNKYYGTFDSYGNQIFIKPKTRVSVITMMNEAVYAMHDDKLLALDIIPDRKKISDRMDFDMEKPVIRKKYIPPYMIAFCAHNKLEFIQKSGLNFMRSIMDKIDYE